MQIRSVGIDLGKTTFHLVALGASGKVLAKKKFSQKQLLAFTANMQASLIGLEACSGAHFLGRALKQQGHDVRLIAAQFVKPFVKSNKNDFVDAEAIAEAVERKNMRFVPIKTDDQLDLQAMHRIRDRLVSRRTFDLGQPLATPTQPDPDQEFVDALVQGIAQDTRSFPTLCNAGVNLRAQISNTPLSVGVSADRYGVHPLGRVSATGPNGGVGVSTNGKNTSVQVTVPFSAVLNGSVSTSQNKVTLGVSKSFNFGGKLSAGGSVTLGYIGDASCR